MSRRFTGWHMFAILVAGFGTVVAVNFTMAYFATSTFGGTVVDNSYVASQRYNDWLADARRQDELGWTETIARDADRIAITVESAGRPIEHAEITGMAVHPLGRAEPVRLRFEETGPGRYRTIAPLAEQRWQLRIEILRGGERKQILREIG